MEENDQRTMLLSRIAKALGTTVEDLDLSSKSLVPANDCLEIIRLFVAIKDPDDRNRLLAMARGMVP